MTKQILKSNDRRCIVVTGGKGFVGQHLVRELQTEWVGSEIFVWDLPEVDVTQPETYRGQLAQWQPDWVVHLAGLAAVGPSVEAKDKYLAVNTRGTERLLETVAGVSPRTQALVVSSAEVYGLTEQARRGEAVPELPLAECRPANPYAESKQAMEKIVEEKFAARTLRVRPFPHLGPGQKEGFVTSDFAVQIARIEKTGRGGTLHVGNLTTQRDFTDVRDVVRAYRLLMEKGVYGEACNPAERGQGTCGVYNVGSGRARAIQEIADRLIALSTVKIRIEQDPDHWRASDVPVLVGKAAKLRAATGWAPKVSLELSLADILNWWRERV